MTERPRYTMRDPRLTTLDCYRLLDNYCRVGQELFDRPWRVASGSLRRASRTFTGGLLGPWSFGEVLSRLGVEYVNFLSGFATAFPATLDAMATRFGHPPAGLLSEYEAPIGGTDPRAHGTLIHLGQDGATPFVAPTRILDASQGWAAWFVPRANVLNLMQACVASKRIDAGSSEHFEPLDCGHGRSLVVLLAIDHRVTDFGEYREISLAFCLTPARFAAAVPGALFARLLVSNPFSVEPARRLWGLHKDHFGDLHVRYEERTVRFSTGHGTAADFRLTLPRFGAFRSQDVPMPIFAMRQPEATHPTVAMLHRSGAGEGMQVRGDVSLQLGRRAGHTCFCGKTGVPCLCDELRDLGVDKSAPAANGWTERMSGVLDAPVRLSVQPLGNNAL